MAGKRDRAKGGLHRSILEIEAAIRDISSMTRRQLHAEYAKGGLTGPQRSVMQVAFHSGPTSLKRLSELVGLSHSTVSVMVDRMVERGMLRRDPDRQDRRRSLIGVTDEVHRFMRSDAAQLVRQPIRAALERASSSDRETIVRGLALLRKLLVEFVPAVSSPGVVEHLAEAKYSHRSKPS